jgi:hypothetical protein
MNTNSSNKRIGENKLSGLDNSGSDWRTLLRDLVHNLDRGSRSLTITGYLMLADIVLSLTGLIVDPSTVGGAPTWMKPLKFAISTGLFSFTVAFMIGKLNKTRRFATLLGRVMALALTLEIVLIDMQAARHTASHFNQETPFDKAVFGIMGIGIAVLFLSTILVFLASCAERFQSDKQGRSMGWVLRLGLGLSLAGMATGILMALPSRQQLTAAESGQKVARMGSHTVGAPDGGPGMPLTGWSADHGDLRIAHFIGLHCMQVLLLGWLLTANRAGWSDRRQTRLIWVLAASVSGIFSTVLWQALRGQPFLRPDAPILASWAVWLVGTAALLAWVSFEKPVTIGSAKNLRQIGRAL